MNQALVLTLIGSDRPGLVGAVAKVVATHGGNWVESRMAKLAGKFAGVLRIDVPADRSAELTAALENLEASGLQVIVEPADAEAAAASLVALQLELIGHDRPGIVHEVTQALVKRGINVVELETECFDAPMTGEAMFRMTAELRGPAELSVDELEEALEQVGDAVSAEITLSTMRTVGG